MKTFDEFVNNVDEKVKEIPYKDILQKIKDGEYEADQDVVKGKLVSMRKYNGKKSVQFMVRVL